MSIARRFWTNSTLYALTNFAQKGAAFLLLPLYTLYLDPQAYGVLAVVTALNGFLAIAFTLSLNGAVTRFYFDYRANPELLREFWGSVLSFVVLLSVLMGSTLLLVGEYVLGPLLGEIPFWPYAALGVMATLFQPFFATFLTVLQTRNEAGRYALISLAHFALLTVLTLVLVVDRRAGVSGALAANLIAAAVFFAVSLWLLRHDFRVCLKWRHLRPALSYSLPQVPHAVAGQVTSFTDRMVLNHYFGTATAGIYAVGAMVALIVEVAAHSVNRAYVPISMEAWSSRGPAELGQLRALGTLVVASACLLGAAIAAYSREIVLLFASPAFRDAAAVVPVLAYAGVASAFYYLFVNILFFERSAIKLMPLGTLVAAGLSVILALVFVPRLGLIGAALSTLVAQSCATILIAWLGHRFDPVKWQHWRYASAFAVGFACALALSEVELGHAANTALAKLAGLGALGVALGGLLWRQPLILYRVASCLLRRRPADAAALLSTPRAMAS